MKKIVLYIRKSTLIQEYEHQENLLIDVCKKNEWEIIDTNQFKVRFLSRVIVYSKYFIVFFKMQVFLATFFYTD